MKRKLLIIASSDPRSTGAVAEAVRVAAGLSSHERLEVTFCFDGPAVESLRASPEDLVDGDFFRNYLPVLDNPGTILTTRSVDSPESHVQFTVISPDELRTLVEQSERLLRF